MNIGKKNKDGKHPPCGTSGKKRGYSKMYTFQSVPSMSKKDKKTLQLEEKNQKIKKVEVVNNQRDKDK